MKKTVIFDLDGTLLNTLDDLADSTNYALSRFGYPTRTIEEVRQFVGNGVAKLIERAIPEGKNNPNFEYITMSSGDEKNDSNIKNATTVDTKSESAFKVSNVNINTATQTELETLPGIGPSLALKIINYRKENGKFKSIEELKSVNGIGENKYEEIKKYIYV